MQMRSLYDFFCLLIVLHLKSYRVNGYKIQNISFPLVCFVNIFKNKNLKESKNLFSCAKEIFAKTHDNYICVKKKTLH